MFLSDLSIKRPIMVSMILIVFLLFGGLALFQLQQELTPDINLPAVMVQTVYQGAGPREIETQTTKVIEDAISSISQIDYMQSYSLEGVSLIVIMFELDKNVDIASQEVKDKVDAVLSDLPDGAERPIIQKFNPMDKPVVDVVLTGNLKPTELYYLADNVLKDRFAQIDGVAAIDVTGGEEREIRVELDNRVVFQNAISLNQLSQILAAENMDMPGGNFKRNTQEVSVRLKGEFADVATINELEVPTAYGPKKLRDIATVLDTGAEVRKRTTYFNNLDKMGSDNVVVLGIRKSDDGNTVDIAKAIKDKLPEVTALLPAECNLLIATDNSTFTEDTVKDTMNTIILGIILTALVLLLFLHNIRSTIIVALSMPMSVISTFLLLKVSGYSLNIMSLMGLSTSVGILVSNSVVVIENIFRYKQMGHSKKDAASRGTNEIVAAVMAATLTNLVVFLPLANMTSLVGSFFKQFGMTVVYATIFSLIMSFTLVPMLASIILPEKLGRNRFGEKFESLYGKIEAYYRRILDYSIRGKKRAFGVILTSLALLVGSLFMAGHVGFEFMPKMDEGDINVEIELPLGYNLDETAALVHEIDTRLHDFSEVKHTLATVGELNMTEVGTNMALLKVKLIGAGKRSRTTNEMAGVFIERLSDIPNATIRVLPVSSIGRSQAPVQLNISGPNSDTLAMCSEMIMERIKDVPGLIGLNSSSRPGKPEIALYPDRKKLADAGLTVYDLAMTLRSAIEGVVTTRFRDQGEEYDIRLTLNDASVDSPEEIGNLAVAAGGMTYTLSQLTDIVFARGFSKIDHYDRAKTIQLTGNVAAGYVLGNIVDEVNLRLADCPLPNGFKTFWKGDAELMADTLSDMLRTFLIAFILTYMLLAAILESLTQPLIILGTVPLAFIGVFGGLFLTGVSMNSISMLAIVMLLGIVVNNAILQLDYTNILIRDKKMNPSDALLKACPERLRPIIMSTAAIILGMIPMALGMGASGREIRQSMGVVSIGGLVASAILSLIVIPVLYNLTVRKKAGKGEDHAR